MPWPECWKVHVSNRMTNHCHVYYLRFFQIILLHRYPWKAKHLKFKYSHEIAKIFASLVSNKEWLSNDNPKIRQCTFLLTAGIEMSNRNSKIYLCTDADAKDEGLQKRVSESLRGKSLTPIFLLTGQCSSRKKRGTIGKTLMGKSVKNQKHLTFLITKHHAASWLPLQARIHSQVTLLLKIIISMK